MRKYDSTIAVKDETRKRISRIRNKMQVVKNQDLTLDDCLNILADRWAKEGKT